jgi:hypothetical protein
MNRCSFIQVFFKLNTVFLLKILRGLFNGTVFIGSMLISVGNISLYLKITISNTRDIVRFAHSCTHTKQHRTFLSIEIIENQ